MRSRLVWKEPASGKLGWLIQAFLLLGLPLLLNAKAPSNLSDPPSITSFSQFGLDEGLVTNCLDEAFLDRKGRLWLNPCKNTAKSLELSFFQFDGRQSTFYDLRPEWLNKETKTPIWFIYGETTSGFLFGADRRNHPNLFVWHPDTREQYFYVLEKGIQLLNLVPDDEGGLQVLTRKKDTYQVFRLFEGSMKLVGAIQLDFKDDLELTFPYPFEVKNQRAWFFHQRSGLVEVDLTNGKMHYQTWSEMANSPSLDHSRFDYYDIKFEWKLIAIDKDELFLYLGQNNGFYTYNSRTKIIAPNTRLNRLSLIEGEEEQMLKVYPAADEKGNLLIVSGYFDPFIATSKVRNFQDTQSTWSFR